MIRLILVLSLFLLSLIGFSQTDKLGVKLTAKVVNASNNKGKIYFALYNSEENFIARTPVATASSTIQNGISKAEFSNVMTGFYAIICFHDANDNGKMDFQENGMPLEDFGMTNNVMSFEPPQFKNGKFEVTNADLSLSIKF